MGYLYIGDRHISNFTLDPVTLYLSPDKSRLRAVASAISQAPGVGIPTKLSLYTARLSRYTLAWSVYGIYSQA